MIIAVPSGSITAPRSAAIKANFRNISILIVAVSFNCPLGSRFLTLGVPGGL
jgi:hypothetical protein